ncbi:MAG: response regulator [Deltaproteobacteria bacterium]|nr:response regulator [Candidatus Anaeroferrophillus wilburensis]MBN2889948.1 response regulator [Deltaproteobacteria bacterium]
MDLFEKKILVVDDEADIREILADALDSLGYRTDTATDGEQAIKVIDKEHDTIAAVICDLKMPKISGEQVVQYLASTYPIIPIIILTGFAQLDMALDHIRMGAFDYMTKPFKVKELAVTLKRALDYRKLKEEQERYQEQLEARVKEVTAELNNSVVQSVGSLIMAIEEKDVYTRGHSHRVAFYSSMVAQNMNFSTEDKKELEYAALLHDVGKIGISEQILNKPGKLNNVEYEIIKSHPSKGVKILEPLSFLKNILPIIEAHHERHDGRGYPTKGLMHDQIPLLSRIISTCDAYDAMTSTRSYREALDKKAALQEIKNGAGSQFDPIVVDAFIATYNKVLADIQ